MPIDTPVATAARRTGRSGSARPGRSARSEAGRPSRRRSSGTAASRKAYVRRQRRVDGGVAAGPVSSPREMARRIPFVVLVLALFVAGIGLTLWLTTSATARSQRISDAVGENALLLDQKEALERIVEAGDSAPELAGKAAELGMVQATDIARLVVAPDGSVTVHGTPAPAQGPPPRDLSRAGGGADGTAGVGGGAPGTGGPAGPAAAPSGPRGTDSDAGSGSGSDSDDIVLPPADAVLPPADARVLASVPAVGPVPSSEAGERSEEAEEPTAPGATEDGTPIPPANDSEHGGGSVEAGEGALLREQAAGAARGGDGPADPGVEAAD